MIGFWNWLLHGRELKLSHLLYQYLYNSNTNSKWLQCIKNIFVEIGKFDIWQMQGQFHMQSLSSYVKNLLMDQYIQIRFGSSTWSSKSTIYFSFKSTFSFEKYLTVSQRNQQLTYFDSELVTMDSQKKQEDGMELTCMIENVINANKRSW